MASQVAAVASRCDEAKESGHLNLTDAGLLQVPAAVFLIFSEEFHSITGDGDVRGVLSTASGDLAGAGGVNSEPRRQPVTSISLVNNSLSSLSNRFAVFTSLAKLDLSYNRLNNLPPVLSRLPLRNLNISHNYFKELPLVISEMELSCLNVASNSIKRLEVDQLKCLMRIDEVCLVENPLDCETEEQLQSMGMSCVVANKSSRLSR